MGTPLQDAKAHLAKAKEFLDSAEADYLAGASSPRRSGAFSV